MIRAKKRNRPNKLAKHMMHLVRLYLMAFDILERGEIVTYREKDHDLLMDIRAGKYLEGDAPTKEFEDILESLQSRFDALKETTELPKSPDEQKINKLIYRINERSLL